MNHNETHVEFQGLVRRMLELIGEDPDREGLKETPARVARMFLNELCSGVQSTTDDLVSLVKVFRDENVAGQLIAVRDVTFSSICEHHLLPFTGVAHVVYIPNGKGMISGLSKVARVLDKIAAKPQVQERVTAELFAVLEKAVEPTALLVSVEAEHQCMICRGVKRPGSSTATMRFGGLFSDDPHLLSDARSLIQTRG